jgi:hypothetical protein
VELETSAVDRGSVKIDFVLGLLERMRGQVVGGRSESGYDDGMPKVDDANRVRQFMVTNTFNDDFERWAAEVEKEHGGKLVVTHEEPIVSGGDTVGFMMWWRVDQTPHVAPRRGR